VQADTVRAAERARDAGFEWLQLHFAHGYLAQEFFSPLSNKRTDQYGGSAENRARYLLETFRAVRRVWPEDKPLNVRLSVIEYFGDDEAMMEESITLLKQMKAEGLDFADISVGFNTWEAKVPWGKDFLVPVADQVLKATGLAGSTAWFLTRDAAEADALVREGKLDLVSYARPFLENPHFPYHLAKELKLENAAFATLPAPYAHWVSRYR
jgi:2,4-dienoyl-CoA reductase-like NADH-dependent reductase (Old Yellow Enzyme family)